MVTGRKSTLLPEAHNESRRSSLKEMATDAIKKTASNLSIISQRYINFVLIFIHNFRLRRSSQTSQSDEEQEVREVCNKLIILPTL